MAGAGRAIARELQNFGGALQNYGVVVYKVDAKKQFDEESRAIAGDIDAFTKSLYTDPDHGTPDQGDGYMKKWDEFGKQVEKRLEKVDNPLARQELDGYWDRTRREQGRAVYDLQFKGWASDTISGADKRIKEAIDTSAMETQQLFEFAQNELLFLRDNNLINEAEFSTSMASYSQAIIRKGMTDQAKALYAQKGLESALLSIADAKETYTAWGKTYQAGDELKALVEHDIKAYHGIIQDGIDKTMETAYSNMLLDFEGKKRQGDGTLLSFGMIAKSKLDTDRKMYWYAQLEGYRRAMMGSGSDNSAAYQVENLIVSGLYAIQNKSGLFGGKPYIESGIDKDGKPIQYPVTVEGIRKLYADNRGILDAQSGSAARIEKLFIDSVNPEKGAWADASSMIDAIKDPLTRGKARATFEVLRQSHPDMSGEDLMDMTRKIITEKAYTPMLSGRFQYAQVKLLPDSDDRITLDLRRGKFQYHIGGQPGEPAQPIYWQSSDALRSFEAGFQKELEAVTGRKDAAYAWVPTDRNGNYTRVAVFRDGLSTTTVYPMPLVQASGRTDATLLRETTKGDEVSRELWDPATKAWVTVTADNEVPDGYTLPRKEPPAIAPDVPSGWGRASPPAAAVPAGEWPADPEKYPAPESINSRVWGYYPLDLRKKWYEQNGYTWDGSRFTK